MTVGQLALPTRSTGHDPPRAHPLGSDAVRLILVGFAYFALAYLGLRLASINPSARIRSYPWLASLGLPLADTLPVLVEVTL
jgi:hypothetical protein